jgi:hypothetical protein
MSVRGRKTGNRKGYRSRKNHGVVKHFGFDTFFALPDAGAKRDGYLRFVDESEEDYLYPK